GSLVLTPEVNRWVSPSTRNSTTGVYMVVPERSCLLRRELSRSTWVDTSTTVPSACGQSERSACRTHSTAAMLPRITSSAMPIARKMVPTVRLLGGRRIGPGGCGTWSVMIPPRVLPDVCRKRRRSESAADQALGEVALHLVQRHPLLGHRVTLPYRHGLILEGVEVDRDAVRRADLVLAPVAPADRLRVVELDVPVLAQGGSEVTGLRRQVLVARQRQHGGLHRCQPWVELQHGPLVDPALGVGGLVLGPRVHQEGHQRPREPGRRLDHVRGVALPRRLVEVGQVGPGVLAVLGEVEVGAVRDALQLTPLVARELEAVLDVDGALRVVRQLLLRVLVVTQVVRIDAELDVPIGALLDPILVPPLVLARLDE